VPSGEIDRLIAALEIPATARVDQRVPKTLLVENGAPTAADKRRINEGIENLHWVAALKPTTIGVPDYRDAVREYLEVDVLSLELRLGAKITRLTELVHRAVPYPVVLVSEQQSNVSFSLAHKRWSQGVAGATVLDGDVFAVDLNGVTKLELLKSFHGSLSLIRQPKHSLYALYQGWIDALLSLQAATISGTFSIPSSAEHSEARRNALEEIAKLESEMAHIRSAAAKEKQVPRRVELNLELKRMQAALTTARARL
jgi:hypothetical protein